MEHEAELRRLARDALREQRLPPRRPGRMWGGPGIGQRCVICAEVIGAAEVGFDLEFSGEEAGGRTVNHYLHVRCFAAWEFERDAGAIQQAEPPPLTHVKPDGAQPHVARPNVAPPSVARPNGDGGSGLHIAAPDGTMANRERERIHSDGDIR